MKKEDAELKANALARHLLGKQAEHKDSKMKCIIASLEAVPSPTRKGDFEVACFFHLLDHGSASKKYREEIDCFLRSYRIETAVQV
jgi:hypothetical protein